MNIARQGTFDLRGKRQRNRRRRLGFDRLEIRAVPAFGLNFAFGVGAVGANPSDIRAYAVAADSAGDIYVTGSLQGTADFDPGPGVTNLTSVGSHDIVLAKYSPAGLLLWAETLPGASASCTGQGSGIAVDPAGNVDLTGYYSGTVDFDPGPGVSSLTSPLYGGDAFVAQFNPSGGLNWARDIAGSQGTVDHGSAIGVDGSGNVYATGTFQQSATFGSVTLSAGSVSQAFITKLNPSGTFLWAKATSGQSSSVASATSIAVSAAGDVAATGFFSGTVNFDPGASSTTLICHGFSDIFLWKLNSSGNFAWAKGVGGPDYDQGNGIAFDGSGNLYTTGTFTGTVNFNLGDQGSSLTAAGTNDVYILKLDGSGNRVWAESLTGSAGPSVGRGIAVSPTGDVLVTGDFSGTVDFDPGPSTHAIVSAGSTDIFLLQLTSAGTFKDVQTDGGSDFEGSSGLAMFGPTGVAIAGRYLSPAKFGPLTLGATGKVNFFLASLTTDFVAPPGAPSLQAASDTGISQTDGLTRATSPVFDLNSSEAGDAVDLLRDGQIVNSRIGPGAITDPGPVGEGVHLYTARQTNAAGKVSALSAATTVTVDTVPPAVPPAPFLSPGDDSGAPGDNLTNVRRPHILGSAEAGAFVELLDVGGAVLGSAFAGADGSFSIVPAINLADGPHPLSARATDAAGNVSVAGPALNLSIDATAPAAPAPPALAIADDSGVIGDRITNVHRPHLVGSAVAGMTVQMIDAGGAILGTAQVAADGSYLVGLTSDLTDGLHPLSARVIDAAGNSSVTGAAFGLTIDTTPPAAPAAPTLIPADDSATLGDGLTNVSRPRLAGAAEPGSTVLLLDARGLALGQAVAGADGRFTVAPAAALPEGPGALAVRAVDAAGNVGAAGPFLSLTIDTVAPGAPGAPSLLAADDSGVLGDGLTNVRRPRLAGAAEPGALVEILDAAGAVLGSAIAGADGNYLAALGADLADGPHPLRARATDAAGNVGAAGLALNLAIDTVAPATPAAPALLAADDSGALGDAVTNVKAPRLIGVAEANATIQIVDDFGKVLGTAGVGRDGAYSVSFTSPLPDGTISAHVRVMDAAGNLSPASPSLSLTIDSTPPAAPNGLGLAGSDDSGILGDGLTNVRRPHLIGRASANSTVRLLDPSGVVLGTGTAGSDGSFSIQVSSPLGDGPIAIRAQATDIAGNLGLAGAAFGLTIDTTPPAAPAAPTLIPADDSATLGDGLTNVSRPRLAGAAEPGSTVLLLDARGLALGQAVAGADGRFTVAPAAALPEGPGALAVRAVDAAGNVGAAGPFLSLTIDTVAPGAPGAPSLLAADDSGVLGDGLTNVRRPRLAGAAEPGALVEILDAAGAVLGSAIAGADGNYLAALGADLADGPHPLRARATDAAGNVGAAGLALNLAIDTVAPATPAAPALLAADDSGALGDAVTNVNRPHLVGATAAGATVQILDETGTILGSSTAAADGTYSVALVSALADGPHSVRALVIDVAGNVGLAGPSLSIRIITTPPPAPGAPMIMPADDTGIVGDGATTVRRPRLLGFAPAGTVVDLLAQDGTTLGTTTAGADGSYVVQLPDGQGLGVKPLRARSRDIAGNISAPSPSSSLNIITVVGDYEGGGRTDLAGYRPPTSEWLVAYSGGGAKAFPFGAAYGDIPVPGDYDGDGKADYGVFRPSNATWYILLSGGGSIVRAFGAPNLDVPIPADYDGDGKTDIATYRPTTSTFSILPSAHLNSAYAVTFGASNLDMPIPADYDGDGKADIATYRPTTSTFSILPSAHLNAAYAVTFGAGNLDMPIPADYDGDGKADIATYRPTTSTFSILPSARPGSAYAVTFGAGNLDVPVIGDFDGDGKADIATYRPTAAVWSILQSTAGAKAVAFGWAGVDAPLTAPFAYRYRGSLAAPAALTIRTESFVSVSVPAIATPNSTPKAAIARQAAAPARAPAPSSLPPVRDASAPSTGWLATIVRRTFKLAR